MFYLSNVIHNYQISNYPFTKKYVNGAKGKQKQLKKIYICVAWFNNT